VRSSEIDVVLLPRRQILLSLVEDSPICWNDARVKDTRRSHGRWGKGLESAIRLDTGDGNYLEIFANGSAEPKPEGCIIHFALRTDNCDAAVERARGAGAVITTEPKDIVIQSTPKPTPVRLAFCKGPDGEIIEFFQNATT
jgi:predicted enzyme related to lactoylglutathione lyase